MPTAARLVGAVLLAILGWLLSDVVRPLMPEGTAFGWFNYVNAFIGLCVGWVVVGPRVGRGLVSAINNGATGTAVMILWCLFAHSCYEMFRLAMRNRYDGPMEALTAIFLIASEFGIMIATPTFFATAIVGALVVGPAAEQAGKLWR
ncbi:TrgA family protein [uncultured Sulfitobacter sp.]|uniref:TrgA family protein n=1 Tax=uncultured Sulfitobacter sp. TaxID=191468 RepID=UPI002617431E|nr:TrgA family protein [uncultured Sulfitobacter sp.]